MSDVFPGYSNAVRAEKPRIFLNENLNYRRGLVSRASGMKKDGLLMAKSLSKDRRVAILFESSATMVSTACEQTCCFTRQYNV